MPSDRLKEAMKRSAYSHEKVNKGPSGVTGKADEEPNPAPRKPYTKERQEGVEGASVRPGVYRKRKEPRNTTAREVNRNRTADDAVEDESADGQAESRTRPNGPRLPPDPYPLQYRDGDPDKEFECE